MTCHQSFISNECLLPRPKGYVKKSVIFFSSCLANRLCLTGFLFFFFFFFFHFFFPPPMNDFFDLLFLLYLDI